LPAEFVNANAQVMHPGLFAVIDAQGMQDREHRTRGNEHHDAPCFERRLQHPRSIDASATALHPEFGRGGWSDEGYNACAMNRPRRFFQLLFSVMMVVLNAAMLHAQESGTGTAPNAVGGLQNEVVIQPVIQGVGGRVRPGEWTAFAISVTDRAVKSRNILVRLETLDIDGDHSFWSRSISTTPGKSSLVWLYARVPFTTDGNTALTVSANEAVEKSTAGNGADPKPSLEAGRRLGTTSFRISSLVNPSSGMMLVIGSSRVGLDRYAERIANHPWAPTGHELTEVIHGVRPAELPDRSIGLRGFETIVWTGSGLDEQPDRLGVPQAEALRTWVSEGGHLIILIPTVGQNWIRPPGTPIQSDPNPLADIMPKVVLSRRDGQNLDEYRYVLTWPRQRPADADPATTPPESTVVLPSSVVIQTFAPSADAGPYDAMPILTGPVKAADGATRDVVVIRRLYGCGAVTLIGLDLTHPGLIGDALRADAFWNRVLGKRLELASLKELSDRKASFPSSRDPSVNFDDAIDASIQREGRSAGGLLLALVVFGAFWLTAGPISFFLLKKRRLVHHAWLVFVTAILLFTVISWTGASMLRQRSPDAKFVAFIDHVYGQPNERARVWANLFLPSYGEQRVSIHEAVDASGRWRPTLSPWEPPGGTNSWPAFPDVRGYTIESRAPESISFPSRSTEKRVQIDWAGPPRWSMPFPQAPDSGPVRLGTEITLTRLDAPGPRKWSLSGTLKHALPGTLEDVKILVVTGLNPIGPSTTTPGVILADAEMFSLVGGWEPDKPLVLDQVTKPSGADESKVTISKYFSDALPPRGSGLGAATLAPKISFKGNATKYFTDLALFSMIAPPEYNQVANYDAQPLVRRETSHTYDLCRWFTQPCVIVIGHLKNCESPVPITVDGETISTSGHTVVRWVYPLPASPPGYEQVGAATKPAN